VGRGIGVAVGVADGGGTEVGSCVVVALASTGDGL
jgi:hypothetical protein